MTDVRNTGEFERVVIVTRKTELEELVARFNTVSQARFYLEHSGEEFAPIEQAHTIYCDALSHIRRGLPRDLKSQIIDRAMVPQYTFLPNDIVVPLGQDGLVSNTAKYLEGQPILAINPNAALYDGILLPFGPDSFGDGLSGLLEGTATLKPVTMARVDTSDGQSLLAFNDFFIGAQSHVSARYDIRWNGVQEYQSSSGLIVSTGAGSTGWLRSVYTGAAGIARELGVDIPLDERISPLPWDTDRLVFAVREPFPSKITGTDLTVGHVSTDMPLVLRSHMAVNGVIFSDGVEADYIAFNSGMEATISVSPASAMLAT